MRSKHMKKSSISLVLREMTVRMTKILKSLNNQLWVRMWSSGEWNSTTAGIGGTICFFLQKFKIHLLYDSDISLQVFTHEK